jgi:hypothetical protein
MTAVSLCPLGVKQKWFVSYWVRVAWIKEQKNREITSVFIEGSIA